jgi:hypothetical protein
MKKLVKILFLAGIAVITLLLMNYFGLVQFGNSAIEKIDKKYGIGVGRLAPPTKSDILAYKNDIKNIIVLMPEEKELQKIKLLLADMQLSLLLFAEHRANFNPLDVMCGTYTEYGMAKSELEKAINYALEIKKINSKIKQQKIGSLDSAYLEDTISQAISDLEKRHESLKKICNSEE